jgi:hypothetical protein
VESSDKPCELFLVDGRAGRIEALVASYTRLTANQLAANGSAEGAGEAIVAKAKGGAKGKKSKGKAVANTEMAGRIAFFYAFKVPALSARK